jgi:dienelactone hydrolase
MTILGGRIMFHAINHPRVSLYVLPLVTLAVLVLLPAPVHAQVARVEMHPFRSTTLTDQEFLAGQKEGAPAILAGELRIPRQGTDRLPAVVLVHGSSGVSGYVDDWVPWLNAMGIATFVFDSFTARGIVNTNNDQDQLGRLTMIVDAYRALDLLGKHSRIDPARIAIMGFSRGGQASLYSSVKRFQRMHGPTGIAFAAYINFYPNCTYTFVNGDDVADKPIRIFHGTADDYNPVAPCRPYVERLRKAGRDVKLTEYAGAQHVFDWAMLKTPVKMAQAQTTRGCQLEEAQQGQIVNGLTKQPFTHDDPCVERGVTVAYNAQAHAESQKAVRDFLTATFSLK